MLNVKNILCFCFSKTPLTTTMLLAVLFFIYAAFFVARSKKRPYLPIIIISLFLFTFNHFTSDILMFISERMGEGIIKNKIAELSTTV